MANFRNLPPPPRLRRDKPAKQPAGKLRQAQIFSFMDGHQDSRNHMLEVNAHFGSEWLEDSRVQGVERGTRMKDKWRNH